MQVHTLSRHFEKGGSLGLQLSLAAPSAFLSWGTWAQLSPPGAGASVQMGAQKGKQGLACDTAKSCS